MKIKTILVIADRKDDHTAIALKRAAEILRGESGGRISLVGFVYEAFVESAKILTRDEADQTRQQIVAHRQADLEQLVAELALSGLKIDIQVVWHREIDQWILREAGKARFDLVMKTGNRSETLWYMPTDWKLMRGCPVPVYIAARKGWRKKSTILATVDFDARSKDQQALNAEVVESAALLAQRLGSELHICHVIAVSQVLKDMDLVDTNKLRRNFNDKSRDRLLAFAAQHGVAAERVHIAVGSPYREIPRQANRLKAELVVMGGFGRQGVRGAMLGNTAEQVISVLRTDVVVIRRSA